MTKIVINACYGGFRLSNEAIKLYVKRSNLKLYSDNEESYYTIPVEEYNELLNEEHRVYEEDNTNFMGYQSNKFVWESYMIARDDPILIYVVEELGADSFGDYSRLKIVEIPDNIEYCIEENDGNEWVAEKHRTWG